MSGGSFNYLCYKQTYELFDEENLIELENMATSLIELGHKDAAQELLNMKYTIEQSLVRVKTMKGRLYDVMHAVEWYVSGDRGKEAVAEAVKEYRGE
ncbi:hypothetical protein HOBO_176 [Bacillus phage Hobo]|uniref:Uncharacterized protein n=2 Tax=Caeruleovirus BM15 TaxID=1985178 RepID=A0A0S2MUL4_9CAUD|nr:hypothetical protein FD732_gp166 [Bacillus phage BM15]ALO79583.1 hypothetical protein BM10_179 [Bacillus phage BM15]AXQ66934.1 hypothetical protein HOBO_176 [Bacillus phage Hobo]